MPARATPVVAADADGVQVPRDPQDEAPGLVRQAIRSERPAADRLARFLNRTPGWPNPGVASAAQAAWCAAGVSARGMAPTVRIVDVRPPQPGLPRARGP